MVTWQSLGLVALLLIGLGTTVFGALSVFGAGMSDAPSQSDGKSGCITAVAGIALVVAAIVGLVI